MDISDHMEDMDRYKNWSPTPFDCEGLDLPDRQDWVVVPVIRTRDSDVLSNSNFEGCRKEFGKLDPEGNDHENHCFTHWVSGWFEIFLVRPDTACHQAAAEIACALDSYPVLDEHDLSVREDALANEAWSDLTLSERIDLCNRYDVCFLRARHDYYPRDDQGAILSYLISP